MNNEEIRERYRPPIMKVLFVGESAPASGNFFYKGDSLTTHVQMAFEKALEVQFRDHECFLQRFKALGFFLDDLSHTPVNHLPRTQREGVLRQSLGGFVERLKSFSPSAIMVSPLTIVPFVEEAVETSNIAPTWRWSLPYPARNRSNVSRFVDGLHNILLRLRQHGVL